ncbi:hypothetical protein GGR57DRAFT_85902 [Xylariaceae sp. FL1272]|nr:hypothetical protein GGR57DRAFT_85902 [Xylariaceae sp. FL1272]
MASQTTTYIPRFLLPQSGTMWRTAVRSPAFKRPLHPDVGQVLVRYASKTATTGTTKTAKATTLKSAAEKVTAPKAASTKATTASKAAKASAPTKPPPRLQSTVSATKAAKLKAFGTKPPAKATASNTVATPNSQPLSTTDIPAKDASAATPAEPTLSPPISSAPAASKPTDAPPKPASKIAVDPSKPIVLEKPERFNPPSHGARLPRSTPKHYGGPITQEEVKAQASRTYPGMPPPPNTWSHWFINSRGIHAFITLGTLTGLTLYTFSQNFASTSPYASMVPPISTFPSHPIQYVSLWIQALRLHEEHESAVTAEKRRQRVDDVAKRNAYRKAHGMEPATGFWGARAEEFKKPEEAKEGEGGVDIQSPQKVEVDPLIDVSATVNEEGKRKKFMGIF